MLLTRPAPSHRLRAVAFLVGMMLPGVAYAQPTAFSLDVTVTDGDYLRTLTSGASADATDDYDPGLDVLAPPAAPPGAFDARLVGQDQGVSTDYFTDLHAVVAAGRHTFRITYAPGDDGLPILLSWSGDDFHPGWRYTLVDQLDDPDVEVNLRATFALDTGAYDETDDPDCALPPGGDPDACIRNGAYLLVDVPAGPVVPDVEPVDAPIVVPPGGGTFSYTAALTNITAQAQTVTADVIAVLPSGGEYGPIVGPRTLNVPPDATFGPRTLRVRVPAAAPVGTYAIVLRVLDGDTVVATDRFTFVKEAAGGPPAAEIAADGARPLLSLAGDAFGSGAALTEGTAATTAGAALVYPNPARGRATLRFTVAESAEARLTVCDALGREIAVLLDAPVAVGDHAVTFEGDRLPSGVYLWQLTVGGHVQAGWLTFLP